jgi:hypothetical protein
VLAGTFVVTKYEMGAQGNDKRDAIAKKVILVPCLSSE